LDDTIIIRDMESGSQETVPVDKVVSELQKRLDKLED
jgi:histidyl-tRNA synthetase